MTRLVCIALFLAGTGFSLSSQAVPKNLLGTGPEVVAAGHTIYNRTCTACQGVDGGEGEGAPALVGDRRFFRLSENAIFDTIKEGIPGTAMRSSDSQTTISGASWHSSVPCEAPHLREALTEERPIPHDYRPVKVVTKTGETVEGVAKNEDGFSIQILDFQDKLHLYDTNNDDVSTRKYARLTAGQRHFD